MADDIRFARRPAAGWPAWARAAPGWGASRAWSTAGTGWDRLAGQIWSMARTGEGFPAAGTDRGGDPSGIRTRNYPVRVMTQIQSIRLGEHSGPSGRACCMFDARGRTASEGGGAKHAQERVRQSRVCRNSRLILRCKPAAWPAGLLPARQPRPAATCRAWPAMVGRGRVQSARPSRGRLESRSGSRCLPARVVLGSDLRVHGALEACGTSAHAQAARRKGSTAHPAGAAGQLACFQQLMNASLATY